MFIYLYNTYKIQNLNKRITLIIDFHIVEGNYHKITSTTIPYNYTHSFSVTNFCYRGAVASQ